MTEADELEVIRRVVDGDIEAFERLVVLYQDSLQRMIATLLHDERRLAEDIAQTVLVEAFHRLADFDPDRSRFSTWLFMIGRSRALNALRKKRPVLLAEIPETSAPPNDTSNAETYALLDRALQQLPPKQKRAFTLVVLEGLSYEDASCIEATTPGTMKSRVSRAREFLRASIQTD
ncbi:RNA polymerase sigma-70 factor (ECF subfamily) [Haloferula luteola]|uniref:RNA polymerase sigma factor n=1 Tax=Haloferula luteola TaxID=595692 RepID=A0A840VH10_9BACT|nr:sigma-70 family RNA polymerase sigma factor [Haloferula luteola]MBB5353878.1 RNA polymerase sigma-70 factor (ECF subfamily) [Haloferula luteola]